MSEMKLPNSWINVASEIDACRQQLRACEKAFRWWLDKEGEYHEDEAFDGEKEYLAHRLFQAHLRMLLLIESLNLPLFRESYLQGFKRFKNLRDVDHWTDDRDVIFSKPLTFIDQHFEALSAMALQVEVKQLGALAVFEGILRQTPFILTDIGLTPLSESDVRNSLWDFLKVVFPDTRREIPVQHIFKKYRADLGSSALEALVEIKYAVDEKELRNELDGIYADIKGYAGDSQWKHFFALIYTTAPIASPERIAAEFELSNVDHTWTPIIVHGPGDRRKRVAPSLPVKKSKTALSTKTRPVTRSGGRSSKRKLE